MPIRPPVSFDIFHFSENHSKQLTLCHYLLTIVADCHDIVQPGTIDNSVLFLIISVLSFKGIHNGICNSRFFSMCTSLLQEWMSMTMIAFSSSLFSDKVDNTDGLKRVGSGERVSPSLVGERSGEGAVPLPRNFFDFLSGNGAFWCILDACFNVSIRRVKQSRKAVFCANCQLVSYLTWRTYHP